MAEPINIELYKKATDIVKRRVSVWPSAYASGQVVNLYKKMGGQYTLINKTQTVSRRDSKLNRWYREDWRNVCVKDKNGEYVRCGRKTSSIKAYPYCRPRHRVSSKTPKTIGRISSKTIKRMCSEKRRSVRKSNGKQTRIRLSDLRQSRGGRKSIKRISTIKTLPYGTKFKRGNGRYKYTAEIPINGKTIIVQFGHRDYQHYRDSVPKIFGGGIWSKKDHLDKTRRDNYRKRHKKVLNKFGKPAYKVKYSPAWFSYYFLW